MFKQRGKAEREQAAILRLAKEESGGGVGGLLLGLIMMAAGGYLLSQQIRVTIRPWQLDGMSGYGLALIPLMMGFVLVFMGRARIGALAMLVGVVIIGAGMISTINLYFRQMSLFTLALVLMLIFGGIGLAARTLVVRSR